MYKLKKIAIGCDHAGYELKEYLKNYLIENKIEIEDFGAFSEDSTDYAEYAHMVANSVAEKKSCVGVLICGSGNGISMAANKHSGIRAALCWNIEIAKLARQHNDANILSLPARFISEESAIEIVKVFLEEKFEGGRHQRRVSKINE